MPLSQHINQSHRCIWYSWLAPLVWICLDTPFILLIGRIVIQLRADILKCMLGTAPRLGPFSLLVARPYSFLDVGLDFQARRYTGVCTKPRVYFSKEGSRGIITLRYCLPEDLNCTWPWMPLRLGIVFLQFTIIQKSLKLSRHPVCWQNDRGFPASSLFESRCLPF